MHRKEYEELVGQLDTHGDEEEDHNPLIGGTDYAPLDGEPPKKGILESFKKSFVRNNKTLN